MKPDNNVIRIISGIIYAICFFYIIIETKNWPFYVTISLLLFGSIYEIIKISSTKWLSYILVIYVIITWLILIKLKNAEQGDFLLIVLIINVWSSDLGGYAFGIFGKHTFCKTSPKKTIEGILGSFFTCFLTSIFLQKLLINHIDINFTFISFMICTSSILGDLLISKFKRINQIKESGFFLPAHGGFLDRLDSLFLSSPIYYFLICI